MPDCTEDNQTTKSPSGAGNDLPAGTLGPLESQIMTVVWARGNVTVRDVHQALLKHRDIAYTSVMTVMGNLTAKGILGRRLEGKAYTYWATISREELTRSRIHQVFGSLLDKFTKPVVSYLVGYLGSLDENALTELEAEVSRLRRQRSAQGQEPETDPEDHETTV